MQLALGAKIHLHAEGVFDAELQPDDVEKRRASGHVDEQVEVAALAVKPLATEPNTRRLRAPRAATDARI